MRWTPCLLALGLAACSGEETAPAQNTPPPAKRPTIPAALVPENAVALLVVPSLEGLTPTVLEVYGLFDEGPPPFPTEPAALLDLAGVAGDLSQLDPSRPLGVAFSIEGGPSATFILPVLDGERFVAPLAGSPNPYHLDDGYALLGAPPSGQESDLARDVPAGLAALRIDVTSVRDLLIPLMVEALESANAGPQGTPVAMNMLAPLIELSRELLYGTRTLDLVLDWRDGRLLIEGAFELVPGRAFADWVVDEPTGAAELARGIDPDAAMMFAGGVAPSVLRERMLPWAKSMVQAYPEPLRQGMLASVETMEPHYDQVGRTFVGSQSFGSDGLRYSYLLTPDDPAALVEVLLESFCSTPFFDAGETTPVRGEEGGVAFVRVPVGLDAAALAETMAPDEQLDEADLEIAMGTVFGEGMELVVGRRDGYVAAAVGQAPDVHAPLDRLRDATGPPAPLAPLLREHGHANPLFVGHVDMARVMQGAMEMAVGLGVDDAPALPADLEVGLQFFAAGADGRLRFGIQLDLASLARLVEALQR